MKVGKDKVVGIGYTLKNEEGEILDRSEAGRPLDYLHGSGSIVPGLERALEGRGRGDALQVAVAPEDGYGVRDEELVFDVPRAQFESSGDIAVGMNFRAETPFGPHTFTVVKVEGETVTVDGNHPLAGETLHFDVTIEQVREATAEELSHGHVHGDHGHGHGHD